MQNLVATLEAALLRCELTASRLIVAVSGGADSVALLLGLVALRERLSLDLVVAHVDHRLRPESGSDAAHVRALAESMGLPFHVETADVSAEARRRKLGIEEAARFVRYGFFGRLGQALDARAVVVGHTADDQTETRLLHLVRGAGRRGLIGMPEDGIVRVPDAPPVRVVRPLLSIPRAATAEFCRARGVTWRDDPTNQDRTFARNRLRHAVVPELRAINPGFDLALERLARSVADADEFVEDELDRRLGDVAVVSDDRWVVDRDAWRGLAPALQRSLLIRAGRCLGGDAAADLGADHVDRARDAGLSWHAGRVVEWPAGLRVRIEHETIAIERPTSAQITTVPTSALPVDLDANYGLGPVAASLLRRGVAGAQAQPSGRLEVRRRTRPCPRRNGDAWHVDLDRAKLGGGTLIVRSRRPGDRIAPTGLAGRKKLQDVFVDGHVPRAERDRVPVVAMGSDVVWVAGMHRDRRFVADEGCREVLCLRLVVEPEEAEDHLVGEIPDG